VKYYCCPPVKEAFRAGLFLASQEEVQSLLVVPAWISAPFWAGLQNSKKFKSCVVQEKMFRSKFVTFNQADSVFGRNCTMNMMAFLLKTKVRQYIFKGNFGDSFFSLFLYRDSVFILP
jgi:hypothetical protein